MKNILIVEDSKSVNSLIKNELTKLNYKCHQAFDFKKAKVFLSKMKYDLIILDLHLPDGDGYDLITEVKSLTDTKVVILTGNTEQQLREELFHYGVLDYIIKDNNISYSINEIHKTLQHIEQMKKKKILVVDDSTFICKQIKLILEPRNYGVTIVKTAKEGLEKLFSENFDLVTLDMELPDIHGIEVLEQIRSKSEYDNLPVLIISGSVDSDTIRKVYKLGGNEFIRKPFIVEEFALKVDLWIDYRKKMLETIEQKDILLSQQSKMATLGEMLGNIIHQAKQPLSIITTLATSIDFHQKSESLTPEILEKNIGIISDSAIHLGEMMTSFKEFYQKDKSLSKFNLPNLIDKSLYLVESKFRNREINIVKDLVDIDIIAFDIELLQVFINILNNARDELEKINTKRYIFINTKIIEDRLEISFKDNAGGVKEEILDNIFDANITTKEDIGGTGIGLHMSKEIIEKHHDGTIKVLNEEYTYDGINYKGANFIIDIPIKDSELIF